MDGGHQVVVEFGLKEDSVGKHFQEIEVFISGTLFGFLLLRGLPLKSGAFQVESVVHAQLARQDVVHDNDADVLGVAAVAVQPEELGEQRSRVLVEIHVITGQEFL